MFFPHFINLQVDCKGCLVLRMHDCKTKKEVQSCYIMQIYLETVEACECKLNLSDSFRSLHLSVQSQLIK